MDGIFETSNLKMRYLLLFAILSSVLSCSVLVDGNNNNNQLICNASSRESSTNLLISEVTTDWVEIYNFQISGSEGICLGDFKIRTSTSDSTKDTYYSLPNYTIKPQTYAIIRFTTVPAQQSSSNVIIINGSGLKREGGLYKGFYEIVYDGATKKTIDYIGFCQDGSGSLSVFPLTGTFSGCVNYPSSVYLSFTRSQDLTDSDSSEDWIPSSISTFGGDNDVLDPFDGDNDGIPDANEQQGTTFAGMPLYDWGARVGQRDIFVHINYMAGDKQGLRPPKGSLDKVKKVFADNNFAIHFDVGDLYHSSVSISEYNMSESSHKVPYTTYVTLSGDLGDNTHVKYKNRYMPINRFGIFHYVLFADTLNNEESTTLGIAELPGNDVVITIASLDSYENYSETAKVNFTASILFHELGHNFGLRHGGFENANYKLNHFSSMNYGYTFEGIPDIDDSDPGNFFNRYLLSFRREVNSVYRKKNIGSTNFVINYSYGVMPLLNERILSEKNPLGSLGDIDWNNDGIIQNRLYTFDINPADGWSRETFSLMLDYNEWANLRLPFNSVNEDYNHLSFSQRGISESTLVSSRFEHLKQETHSFIECNFGLDHRSYPYDW